MSIPENSLYPYVVYSPFTPDKNSRVSRTKDYEYGGIHYRDSSLGLMSHIWIAELVEDDIVVYNKDTDESFIAYSGKDIEEFSFAMDTANNPIIAARQNGILHVRWFDFDTQVYIVTSFTGIRNACICLDDKLNYVTGTSSIILAYIRNDNLYFRDQRDAFSIEYLLKELSSNIKLLKIGMNEGRRLQFQLVNTDLL